jgi:hypothetical protein
MLVSYFIFRNQKMQISFAGALASLRPFPMVEPFEGIVIVKYTETGYNFIPAHHSIIHTKLAKLVRQKRLIDCLDLVTAHLGVNDEQAIAFLRSLAVGLR